MLTIKIIEIINKIRFVINLEIRVQCLNLEKWKEKKIKNLKNKINF